MIDRHATPIDFRFYYEKLYKLFFYATIKLITATLQVKTRTKRYSSIKIDYTRVYRTRCIIHEKIRNDF